MAFTKQNWYFLHLSLANRQGYTSGTFLMLYDLDIFLIVEVRYCVVIWLTSLVSHDGVSTPSFFIYSISQISLLYSSIIIIHINNPLNIYMWGFFGWYIFIYFGLIIFLKLLQGYITLRSSFFLLYAPPKVL